MVGFLVLIEFCSGLIQGWIPTLLPDIARRYHVTAGGLSWTMSSYLLGSALFVPVLSKLGDLLGHRRMLRIAVALTALGSVLVALAPSYGALVAGRVLVGALTAFLPLEFAIVRDRAAHASGGGIGLLVGSLTFGAAVGTVLSGLTMRWTHDLSATLWVPAVIMILCLPVPWFLVQETTTRATGRVDWVGAALIAVGLASLLYGLSQQPSRGWTARTTGLIVGGIVVLAIWTIVELRSREPLVDLRRLRVGGTGPLFVITALIGIVLFGTITMQSVYMGLPGTKLGYGLGLGALQIGLTLLPASLAAMVGASVASRLGKRLGDRTALAIGLLVSTVGYAWLAVSHHAIVPVVVGTAAGYFGCGVVMATVPAMILQRTEPTAAGVTSGMYNILRTSAGSVGTVAFGMVLARLVLAGTAVPREAAFVTIWVIAAVVCALALLLIRAIRPWSASAI
jgi:MFS family permease